jgi:hypothetical protein
MMLATSSANGSRFFIRVHHEALSVAAMSVSNPDCSPLAIHRRHPAQAPSGFLEIVGDYFPVLHSITDGPAAMLGTR